MAAPVISLSRANSGLRVKIPSEERTTSMVLKRLFLLKVLNIRTPAERIKVSNIRTPAERNIRTPSAGRGRTRALLSDGRASHSVVFQALHVNPKPETRDPEPGTRDPKPETRNPEPGTRNPRPGTRTSNPIPGTPALFSHTPSYACTPKTPETATRNPQPETRNPKPGNRNPRPETQNPRPGTQNPKPETRNPEPATRNPQPATRNSKPKNLRSNYYDNPKPGMTTWGRRTARRARRRHATATRSAKERRAFMDRATYHARVLDRVAGVGSACGGAR